MKIIVNGRNMEWSHETIFYNDLLLLASKTFLSTVYTVTYYLPKSNEQGSLVKGQQIICKDGMIFNVVDTSNA